MKATVIVILALAAAGVEAADPAPPPATVAPVEASPKSAAGPEVAPTQVALQEAFDGAMTCSALAALKAQDAGPDQRWQWGNRSFAFGMVAARFHSDLTKRPASNEELDDLLSTYANSLAGMPAAKREPFETGCARKYALMDQLCEVNPCPHKPPSAPPAATPAKP